jgi:MFS family permease
MTEEKKPLISPLLLLFIATMILANIGGQMDRPLRPLYVQELGASVKQVGMFFTLGAIAPLLFQIFGGWLSDSIGRLQAIAVGSLGGVLGYLVYIFAPSWEWLLIASVSSAMAPAFVRPSFDAFIAEQSTEETRGRVYGIMQAMFMVVGIIGPPLGGFIAQGLNFKTMFVVAGILYSAAAIIRVLMARAANRREPGEKTMEKPSLAHLRRSLGTTFGLVAAGGVVTWIFVTDGLRDISFSFAEQLTPLYLENIMDLTLVQIGFLNSIFAGAMMLFSSLGGWLSDRKGERVGIAGGFLVMVIGWAFFLLGGTFLQFAAAWGLLGVGQALIGPSYSSLISKVVPENLRGTAFGLFATSIGLISLPTPWIGAQLWEVFTPRTPFYFPMVALVLAIPIVWFKFKPAQPPPEAVEEPTVPLAEKV